MNQEVNLEDTPTQRSSRECTETQEVSFVETLAKEDIDAAVEIILCRESYIIEEINKYLQRQDFLNSRRKELLHKRWTENVAFPLQQKIIDKVGSPKEIEKRKCLELDGYLRFRDATVMIPLFRDPLLQAQQDRDEENRAILQCETGKMYTMKEFKELEKAEQLAKLPQSSLARQNVGPHEWLRVPFGYMESEFRQKSRLKVKVDRNQLSSDLVFYPSQARGEAAKISQADPPQMASSTWTSLSGQFPEEEPGVVQSTGQSEPASRVKEGIAATDLPELAEKDGQSF
ncbi:protein FAM228B-like [Sarcophilus harrisii]|uniref:Family with sequence similarity 228 member A n=1 Tax=Sarcophilus harrisii TaxID=9305 RepID=A0A7N4V2H2_SARHA|nr:protein FAM228B-like [Sarcophilus harrisii]